MDISVDITVEGTGGAAGAGAVLVLQGDFDVRSTWEVRTAIYDLLDGHDRDVVVDMTDVDAVDLTALRVLVVATRQAARGGHRLTLRGCGPAVRRMLLISHLARAVEIERPLTGAAIA